MTKLYETAKAYTHREIKFRGKLKTTGEWVYGDLVRLQDGENEITAIYYKGEVDPKTVGQFTGFTDRNGTDIYEGDILTEYDEAVVIFRDGTWKLEWFEGYDASDLADGYDETMMICGNIYDEEQK